MMRLIIILLFVSFLFTQDNVQQLINSVHLGKTAESKSALPALQRDFPNQPDVIYLAALLETDGIVK